MPTFATPAPITAHIEPVVGNIRIVASERTDTVVDVRPTDEANASDVKAAQQTVVEFSANTLTVKGPRQSPFDWSNKTRSIDVTVELPAGSRVLGSTGVGDLRSEGRLGSVQYKSGTGHFQLEQTGDLQLTTATGSIVIGRVDGNAELNTSTGQVQVGEITGSGVVKNSNGSTTIGTSGGSVRVRSANGDITLEHPADAVDAKTANGSVRVLDAIRSTHTLETSMGDIEIGIREGTAAWLDVNTRFGNVRNEMSEAGAPDGSRETAEVRAHTSVGDITIHRS